MMDENVVRNNNNNNNNNSSCCSNSNSTRGGLSWSQSVEANHPDDSKDAGSGGVGGCESSSQEIPTQSQNDILTQTADLTQMGDMDELEIMGSPEWPPYSPSTLMRTPWGRLMPCSPHVGQGIDLLPRAPESAGDSTKKGISIVGLCNIQKTDTFNEYSIGRSRKCDVEAIKPTCEESNASDSKRHDWAYGMISNKHCRIYCTLDDAENGTSSFSAFTPPHNMVVYVEDCSNNGTLINKTILLRRGEKRRLHSGDEICLVNPQTLRKRIRANTMLQQLLLHHSYVFVNLHQQVVGSTSGRLSFSSGKRRPAVDVRATRQHSFPMPAPRGPAAVAVADASPQKHDDMLISSIGSNTRRISPRRQPPTRIEQDYDIREVLGNGTVGEVRRAIHRVTGMERAVKIISIGGRNRARTHFFMMDSNAATFQVEAEILRQLDHPYVVKLVDVYVSPTAVYLVMELLHGGDLFDRIVEKGKFTEIESRRVMRRLLSAVYYLHEERNIVHRDLKPENILCVNRMSDIDVKLTDFGLAKAVTNDEGLKTFCGTPQYFAPEVLRRRHTVAGRGRYGKQADMWSIGVILYVLLSGTPPFDIERGIDVVANAKITFPEEYWTGISEDAKDLVLALLRVDTRMRLSVRDACNHKWILTHDGDTHCHPLDDPKLPVERMRRVGDTALPVSPSDKDKLVSTMSVPEPPIVDDNSPTLYDEVDIQACKQDDEAGTLSISDSRSHHILPEPNGADELKEEQEPNTLPPKVSLDGVRRNKREKKRSPLAPLLFNECPTVRNPPDPPTVPLLPVERNVKQKDEGIKSYGIEPCEDDILSEFSEKTESISSFPSFLDVGSDDSNPDSINQSRHLPPIDSDAATAPHDIDRRRRVTRSSGDLPPPKKGKHEPESAQKKLTAASSKSRGTKQMKLSAWLKKD